MYTVHVVTWVVDLLCLHNVQVALQINRYNCSHYRYRYSCRLFLFPKEAQFPYHRLILLYLLIPLFPTSPFWLGPEITITRQPGSVICQPGDSVTLICEATCSVSFSYCWYHNDTVMYPAENQSSIGIHIDENTLGSYCCHITIDGYHRKEKRSRVAQLVLGKPAESEPIYIAI